MGLNVQSLVSSAGTSSEDGELMGVSKYGSSTIRQTASGIAATGGGFSEGMSSLSSLTFSSSSFSSTAAAAALWFMCTCVGEVLATSCSSRLVSVLSGKAQSRCHCCCRSTCWSSALKTMRFSGVWGEYCGKKFLCSTSSSVSDSESGVIGGGTTVTCNTNMTFTTFIFRIMQIALKQISNFLCIASSKSAVLQTQTSVLNHPVCIELFLFPLRLRNSALCTNVSKPQEILPQLLCLPHLISAGVCIHGLLQISLKQ